MRSYWVAKRRELNENPDQQYFEWYGSLASRRYLDEQLRARHIW
jgi:hypothetical protein